MKLSVPKNFEKTFELYKARYNKAVPSYDLSVNPIVGTLWWTKPANVLWLYATSKEEGYEGSQTQFGVDATGQIVWGYFSHCSCYGYEDYEGGKEMPFAGTELTQHNFEMESVPPDILAILKTRMKEIVKDFKTVIKP